jgi:hypothetical protein
MEGLTKDKEIATSSRPPFFKTTNLETSLAITASAAKTVTNIATMTIYFDADMPCDSPTNVKIEKKF